jgi:hypothetical protein
MVPNEIFAGIFELGVNEFKEVSLTTVDADAPPAETVRVSEPSVSESFKSVTEIVAIPLELMTAFPLSEPPDTSAALMPDRVYGTDVPDATFVVVSVNVAVEPSFIYAPEAVRL